MNDQFDDKMISIIVCTYNRSQMLADTLKSLIQQNTENRFNYEIVVVDDRSTDNTKQVVHELSHASKIPIKYAAGNGQGIAAVRNVGLDHARSKWIAFFDDDQIADPKWLLAMYECASSQNAYCVGGKRLIKLSGGSVFLSETDRRLLGEIDLGKTTRKCKRKEFPAAGNILLDRSIFNYAGRFDETLVRGGEDIEFAARIRKANIDSWYTPHAIVHHITPVYRTKQEYLTWTSLRAGENFAHRDYLEWGLIKTSIACIARITKAFLFHIPALVWSFISGNTHKRSDLKNLLLRAYAYSCRTLNFISPRIFPLKVFFDKLEFRKERMIFSSNASDMDELI